MQISKRLLPYNSFAHAMSGSTLRDGDGSRYTDVYGFEIHQAVRKACSRKVNGGRNCLRTLKQFKIDLIFLIKN